MTLLEKEKSRPTKIKSMTGKVKSWFPKLSDDERQALVKRLFDESLVKESGASLTYSLNSRSG